MYLRGSKWSMLRKHKPFNPWRILVLLVLIGAAAYVNFIIVPHTQPLFVPTLTPTRAPESYVVDAEALATQGKFGQAIEMYKQAINVDPGNPNNFIAMAKAEIALQQYKEAQTSAENALLLNNNNSTAHAIRGWALTLQDDYLLAENSLKKAIELDPNSGLAHAYYAELLIRINDAGQGTIGTIDKAIEESRLAYALGQDTMEAWRARGVVLQSTQNYAEAIQAFQQAVNLSPNSPDLHLLLGNAYRSVDPPELDKAVTEYTTANALNPADPLPDTYIARTYANIGEYPKAVQSAELAVKDAPTDPYMWGNYGTMLYRNQQLEEAASALQLAVRGGSAPTGEEVKGLPLDYGRIAEYYYIYGLALAKLNRCSDAVEVSQILLQGVPDDETAVFNANAMVIICQGGDPNAVTPEADTTTSEDATETPVP